ncbi:hypothetical protein N7523_010053 [Penicillium sp. IBT 18751x]|nr:hypothetical protein N7523_010053 [Penicillium sp. IBT 18751x]
MMSHDNKTSANGPSRILAEYEKWLDGSDRELCSVVSSCIRPPGSILKSCDRAVPSKDELQSRRYQKVRFGPVAGDIPPVFTQSSEDDHIQPASKQSIERKAKKFVRKRNSRDGESRGIEHVVNDVEILKKEMKRVRKTLASMKSRQREGNSEKQP